MELDDVLELVEMKERSGTLTPDDGFDVPAEVAVPTRSVAGQLQFSDTHSGSSTPSTSKRSVSPSKSQCSSSSTSTENMSAGIRQESKPKPMAKDDEPSLYPGEHVLRTERDVTYLCPFKGPVHGKMTLTNFKLYFKSSNTTQHLCWEIYLGVINRVDKVGKLTNKQENTYGIDITCKDMHNLRFTLRPEKNSQKEMFNSLITLAFPATLQERLFAFWMKNDYDGLGWDVYDAVGDLRRQGFPNDSWRITRINDNYKLCDTYPRIISVPAASTDEDLLHVASFRSRERIPVLSWLHPNGQTTVSRSSQPQVGISGRRSHEDERYVKLLLDANALSDKLFIFDARPMVNAIANKAKGGGYESEDAYQNTELIFLDIANIHVMRVSLEKLKDICYPIIDEANWLSNIESTHWLDHIKLVLAGALQITDKVENHQTSVLVHCSDGWDRTAQLTALSMLMLDSFYRTVVGFEVLIEKEWVSFGHKFAQRIGHGEKAMDNERSPIFLQFIDSVWQMTRQFPTAFEFNEAFLITILDHLYSCMFGTFLCNSEMQRQKEEVRSGTVSLWSYVNSERSRFTNPLYIGRTQRHVILPVASLRRIELWTAYYVSHNPVIRPQLQSEIDARSVLLLQLKAELEREVEEVRKQVEAKRARTSALKTSSPARVATPVNN